jgi:hypothetical protein
VITALLACKPDVAPADLDALLHAFWQDYEVGADTELIEAVRAAPETLPDVPSDGTFSDPTDEDMEDTELTRDVDLSKTRGMWAVGEIGCSEAQIEEVLYWRDQDDLYEYVAYERAYTSDADAFMAGETDVLTWDTTYTASVPLVGEYTAFIHGGMRRVLDGGDTYYFSRTFMPEAAETDGGGVEFDQDYQIEIYWPSGNGVVHLFGMWRYFKAGAVGDTDDDSVVNLMLGGLHDWDDDTSKVCEDGGPG